MSWFASQAWSYVAVLLAAVSAAAVTLIYSRRVLPALFAAMLLVLAVVFLWLLPTWQPQDEFLSREVPGLFYAWYWPVLLVCLLGVIFGLILLVRLIRAARRGTALDLRAGLDPELESAWMEIQAKLSQAHVDLTRANVCLMIAPDPSWSQAVIAASQVSVLTLAPAAPAPVHAYATPEGVLLDVTGISCLATQSGAAAIPRLEAFCRVLLAQQPDCPIVRGIVIAFPAAWLEDDGSVRAAGAVRDDLRTVERVLKVVCPVSVLVPGMEAIAGFREFRDRIPPDLVDHRCGFSASASESFSPKSTHQKLRWMTQWFYGYILEAMVDRALDQAGNNRLFCLDNAFRLLRPRLRNVLETALTTHRNDEPVLLQGCYFLATGSRVKEQAFAAGLIKSRKGGIFSERRFSLRTGDALLGDKFYRRWAIAVAIAGGALAAMVWLYMLRQAAISQWWGIVPVLLAALWAWAIWQFGRW